MVKGFDKKKVKALYSTYGAQNLYNIGAFKPLTRNLTTGALLNRGHHCERCQGAMTQRCYDEFHHAYCTEWTTRNDKRERCGERFALHSGGCGTHPRSQGYNSALYHAADGEDIELSDFDDPAPLVHDNRSQDERKDVETEMAFVYAEAEKYLEEKGVLPENFHSRYFTQRAKEKTYADLDKASKLQEAIANKQTKTGKKVGRGVTFGKSAGRKGRGRDATYDGDALRSKDTNQTVARRSYAPKGRKLKLPMEVPRHDQEDQPKENKAERAQEFARKIFGTLTGL